MRKTLSIILPTEAPEATAEAPAIKKKGRGWEISEKRLDSLHDRAREMRRHPTPAQEALAKSLSETDTGGFSFRRQAVIGSAIVDFACKPLMLVIELEGDEDAVFTATRDRSLAEVGYRVERIPAEAVLADPEAMAAQVVSVMRERWHERRANRAKSGGAPQRRPRGQ